MVVAIRTDLATRYVRLMEGTPQKCVSMELVVDAQERGHLESPLMAQLLDEIEGLYGIYPSWLVTACLVVVGLGLGWLLWKLVRVGMVLLVTVALLAIVVFAGWMILAP